MKLLNKIIAKRKRRDKKKAVTFHGITLLEFIELKKQRKCKKENS